MIDKTKLKASNGVPLSQGLFLEIGYTEHAVFTTKDEDYEYKGKVYPSLKRLYLEMEDAGEYEFACKYLLGWDHWQKLCNNKAIAVFIESWRYELELKLRSRAIKQIMDFANTPKGFQAAKWIADRGWDKRAAGRPSKDEVDKQTRLDADLYKQFDDDLKRVLN